MGPGRLPDPFNLTCPITDSQGSVATTVAGGPPRLRGQRRQQHDQLVPGEPAPAVRASSRRSPRTATSRKAWTIDGNVLYVLNEHSNNIVGFEFTTSGKMTEIPGSNQSLVTTVF